MVDGIGRAKIHIDRGAVGGRAARDAGILPQLQLSKIYKGHAAAAFRLAAGDRSVQNSRLAACIAANLQAAAVFGCLAVLNAAAGDLDDAASCADTAATLCRAVSDDAAGHGKRRVAAIIDTAPQVNAAAVDIVVSG